MASHKQLANWYSQLAQHLESGTRLAEAFMICSGPPSTDRLRMGEAIATGTPIETVMDSAPSWLPRADRIFICTAMETGRLPQTLQNLSIRHEQIGATQMKVVMALIYPLGVFHLAALIVPVVSMIDFETGFEWSASQHALQSAALLVPVWLVIGGILLLIKTHNPLLPRLLRGIPLLRRYSKAQALADLAYSLGTFLQAGVPIQHAWRESVRLSGDPQLNKAYQSMEPLFERGEDPAHYLKQHPVFPPDFVAFYSAGAQSGQLDAMLLKAGGQFQQQANQAMTFAAIVYPTLLFFAVAAFIIYTIFQIFGGYLKMLDTIA